MSDAEDTKSVVAEEEVEVSADATSGGSISVLDALKSCLKTALIHDGLARGLREASKGMFNIRSRDTTPIPSQLHHNPTTTITS